MTAVIIILAVLIFLAVLFFLPVSLYFSFNEELRFKVQYAGIITLYKNSKKQTKEKSENSEKEQFKSKVQKEQTKNFFAEEFERLGVKGFIKTYAETAKSVLESAVWFIKKLRFKILDFTLTVATDNAYDTAIEYGTACAAVYPIFSIICSNAKVKFKNLAVNSDFTKQSYELKTEIKVKASLVFVIAAIIRFSKLYVSIKNGEINKKKDENADE